ncbi:MULTISPECIES: hypothetical protein [Cryobacterium]|uniref:hypothetical protein n=1 Tax=Cryobacterium TaxID=69578 RepID=UPI0013FDC510|nr:MULTISPECIES: hypothetical protein [Cryobacterium]
MSTSIFAIAVYFLDVFVEQTTAVILSRNPTDARQVQMFVLSVQPLSLSEAYCRHTRPE